MTSRPRRTTAVAAALSAIVVCSILAGCSGETTGRYADRIERADGVFNSRLYAQAGQLFEEIADDADAAGDSVAFVEAAAMRARALLTVGDRDGGEQWLGRAEDRAGINEPLGWSRYLGVRGRFEWTAKDMETATATFKEMYEYCDEHGLYERAIDATHMVAITAPVEERFSWARRGVAMAEAGGLTEWLAPLWNNLGWDLVDAGRYSEGLAALEEAREYHDMGGQDLPMLIADYSVAYVHRLMGDIATAKSEMRDVFDRATELRDADNPAAAEWMGFSHWELGEIAAAEGDNAAATKLMTEALVELKGAGMPQWDPNGWQEKQWRLEELR